MKSVTKRRWAAFGIIGLPFLVMAGLLQQARSDAQRRQQQLLNFDLYHAAQRNDLSAAEALLAQGAEADGLVGSDDVDSHLSDRWMYWWRRLRGLPAYETLEERRESAIGAALYTAAGNSFQDWRILKLLIDHGANLNQVTASEGGMTALDRTTYEQNWNVASYLLDHGASPNYRLNYMGMDNSSPLLNTVAGDNVVLATKMLEKGANANFVPKELGDTALCCAVVHQNVVMIRLLLEHGAKLDLPNATGETPLHRCQGVAREVELATLLLQRGADPNRTNQGGDTPLMIAAANNDAPLVRLYLAHGTRTGIRNKLGQTALQIAQARHATEVLAMLSAGSGR